MNTRAWAHAAALSLALALTGAASSSHGLPQDASCTMELVVLGAGQDAGAPQIGTADDMGPRLHPSSLGLIDREAGQRFLFDATPAITHQLAMLDSIEPAREGLGVDGVFLTHAHTGHYLGLAWFGREAAGARGIRVFAMPRMGAFLRENGPWSQLVELGNIEIMPLADGELVPVSDTFGVIPLQVPHRDEFSETVGFVVITPGQTALYLPDIDSFEEWEAEGNYTLEGLIGQIDHVFIDATFWADGELAGRDMSLIPHPRVSEVMERLAPLEPELRARVHFIHINHTNPIRDPASPESARVLENGFTIAREGERMCLYDGG